MPGETLVITSAANRVRELRNKLGRGSRHTCNPQVSVTVWSHINQELPRSTECLNHRLDTRCGSTGSFASISDERVKRWSNHYWVRGVWVRVRVVREEFDDWLGTELIISMGTGYRVVLTRPLDTLVLYGIAPGTASTETFGTVASPRLFLWKWPENKWILQLCAYWVILTIYKRSGFDLSHQCTTSRLQRVWRSLEWWKPTWLAQTFFYAFCKPILGYPVQGAVLRAGHDLD